MESHLLAGTVLPLLANGADHLLRTDPAAVFRKKEITLKHRNRRLYPIQRIINHQHLSAKTIRIRNTQSPLSSIQGKISQIGSNCISIKR